MNEASVVVLRDVSSAPVQSVVDALERMLARAKSGEVRGIVILGYNPAEAITEQAGKWDGPNAMWALECWKHRMLHGQQENL